MLPNSDLLAALRTLVGIESIAGVNVSPEAPYGTGPAEALNAALALCESLGMRTVNRGGKIGYAEIGAGEEIVGVLAHLDTVPAGEGWTFPPYALTGKGDRLYGRGVTDDKGPAAACIFAMKDLLDAGKPLYRRVRLIFGQSEESGDWDDMEYYKAHEEAPAFGFTPDADFPAIYGEKGIVNIALSLPLEESGLRFIAGGAAPNMVPDECRAEFADSNGKTVRLETCGKSAHASTPEDGENAISAMMEALAAHGVQSPLVAFYQKHIGKALYGEAMPCAFEDAQSGKLTMNAGLLRTENDRVTLTLDIRNPVTFTAKQVFEAVSAAAAPFGITAKLTADSPPVYMDKNGRVIAALLSVYRDITGDLSAPTVIGGGTYARAMKNIVAFGPMLPGRELTEHQRDEYILTEDLFTLRDIYRRAIEALAELPPDKDR